MNNFYCFLGVKMWFDTDSHLSCPFFKVANNKNVFICLYSINIQFEVRSDGKSGLLGSQSL